MSDAPFGAYREWHAAKRAGLVVPPASCSDCGRRCVVHGHHPDYSKPLEVVWLCNACHSREHAMMRLRAMRHPLAGWLADRRMTVGEFCRSVRMSDSTIRRVLDRFSVSAESIDRLASATGLPATAFEATS